MPYFSYNDIIDLDSANDDHVLDKTSVKWTANDKQWPEEFQCLNSNCELVSKASCTGTCTCYDSCPTGYAYFPTRSDWSYETGDNETQDEVTSFVYKVPCSNRGACLANGTCQCVPGYIGANCEEFAHDFFSPGS